MTLLAPGAAIIAGAIAIPLLVLLYFLKLRRRPLRVSSTILWDRAVHDLQVNAPFRWLRVTSVLILQLLALACLVIAIGRPAINLDEAAGQRVVVLIDRSAGMSARAQSGGATRLETAKKRARELIDSVLGASGSRVMLVQFAADAQAITPMTADRAVIDEAIGGVTASDQPADTDEALKLLNTAAQKEASETAERSAVSAFLVSSGGFPPTDNNQLPVLAGAELRLVRIGPEPALPTANLGIATLSARRDYEDPTTVRVFLRVVNSAGVAARAPLTLSIDGQQVGSVVLEVPATTVAAPDAGAPTNAGGSSQPVVTVGEATTTVGVTNAAGGVLTVMIDAPDALASDNAASLVMAAASKPRIVLVAPGANGNEADPFLLNALNVLDKASLRVMAADQFAAMESVGGANGAAGNSNAAAPDFDIVFFDRVRPGKTPRAASVSFGAALPIEGLGIERVALAPGTPARRFVSWKRNHPVLRFVPLDTVILNPPMRLQLPNIDGGGEAGGGQERPRGGGADRTTRSTLLADGVDGPLIGLVDHAGVRHVVVGFELERSNWGPQYPFPLFISNCVEFLTLRAEAQAGRSFLTVAPVTVQPVAGVKEITVTPPPSAVAASTSGNSGGGTVVATSFSVSVPDESGLAERRTVSLGVLERAGVYRLSGAVEPAVAVNLTDAWTSLLRTSDTLEVIGQAGAKVEAIGSPREVWRWFVLAAACLLSVEWQIYTLQMRG